MAGRFHAYYTHLTLQRAQGRLAAARRALPGGGDSSDIQPDDDLGQRPLEFPVLKRPAEKPVLRREDEVAPPTPSHVPQPGRTPIASSTGLYA